MNIDSNILYIGFTEKVNINSSKSAFKSHFFELGETRQNVATRCRANKN